MNKRNLHVVAGHVTKCVIAQTCEASLFIFGRKTERKFDDITGLNLLS